MIREFYDKGGCVDCGLPCMGRDCPKCNVTEYICDRCGDLSTNLFLEDTLGEQLCEKCLKKYYDNEFKGLTLSEKASLLGVKLKEVSI